MGTTAEICRKRSRGRSGMHGHRPPPPPLPLARHRRPRRILRRQQSEDDSEQEPDISYEEEDGDKDVEEEEVEEEEVEEEEEEVEGEEEEEDPRRAKKKLKLLLKLPRPAPPLASEDEGEGRRGSCRRGDGNCGGDRKGNDARRMDRDHGVSPSENVTQLPDTKMLESILDKIQRKDKYNVFAQPVDLDELPDYLEIIEHPMDFGTIRKKLARNVYASLEELEGDVLLVCTNAMQYNSPETIYHKQARSMHEMAHRYFQSVRAETKPSETCFKLESTALPTCPRKDTPKCSSKTLQEAPTSSYKNLQEAPTSSYKTLQETPTSSHKTLKEAPTSSYKTSKEEVSCETSSATAVTLEGNEIQIQVTEAIVSEKSVKDREFVGMDTFIAIEGISEKVEKLDKIEELSEKSIPSKAGQKIVSLVENHRPVDENRRATYNISDQIGTSHLDLIFSALDAEKKELVAVGLDAEYSYARSLARFAATLGHTAWEIASAKIEKALPAGVKFGPGWVGEYESMHAFSLMESRKFTQTPSSVAGYAADSNVCKQNREQETKNDELLKDIQLKVPCLTNSHSAVRQEKMPNSMAMKPTPVDNAKEKLYPFQFPPRQQSTAVAHNFIHLPREKKAGDTWKDQNIGDGKANIGKQASSQDLSFACNSPSDAALNKPPAIFQGFIHQLKESSAGGSLKDETLEDGTTYQLKKIPSQKAFTFNGFSDSSLRKPHFQIDTQSPDVQPLIGGYRNEAESYSMKRGWITKNQTPISGQAGFSMKIGVTNQSPISLNVASLEKDSLSSGNLDKKNSSDCMSSSMASGNNTHGNNSTVQTKTEPVISMSMVTGMASKAQNFPNPSINRTRQFIPAFSPTNPAGAVSAAVIGNDSVGSSEYNTSRIPINAWISVGNCSEQKPNEYLGFFKVQPEPNSSRASCAPSTISGMHQQLTNTKHLPPSNLHGNNGGPMLTQSNQIYAEKSYFQNRNPTSIPHILASEISGPQHAHPWRGLVQHNSKQRKSEDTLPPDLNIGFQSPGSPVQRSSGIHVDSQPDLALQL